MALAMPMLGSAEAIAACGASLRLRRDATAIDPAVAARLDAVLDALGVRDAVDALSEHELTALLGVVEGFLAQALDLARDPGRARWDHEQASILMAQGHTSALLAAVFARFLVPALGGDLATRLEGEGAAFLDVGAGVAALSVAMCRQWPALRVVGVDPWEPALALAREHVATAGLAERIELRATTAEMLDDTAAYDLAWVPTFFIPDAVLDEVVARVHAALRDGGGVILGVYVRPENPVAAAVADLRTVRQGGALRTPSELAELLARDGFAEVEIRFDAAWGPLVYVVGRRVA
jgi:2-polyprenyl-3-methyl-5-hydroxy-6-metoxy-1,4-benzoquinol methylase